MDYRFASADHLRTELESALKNAENALERGIDSIYESAMKRVYAIEDEMKRRK